MSESRRACDVCPGDRVWRAGGYWRVITSEPAEHGIWTLELSRGARRTTWRHPAHYDVAVETAQDIQDGNTPV